MSIPTPKETKPTLSVSSFLVNQEEKKESSVEPAKQKVKKESGKYADSLVIQLQQGEKAKIKAFCALHGISLTDFVHYTIERTIEDEQEGKVSVSKYGIKELKQD